MEGDGVWSLGAHSVPQHAGVLLTAHGRCLDVCGVSHLGTLHHHTLETSKGVHTQPVCWAAVDLAFTLVDVCTAAPVSGQAVTGWADAVEAARCVDTLMDAEPAGLTEGEQMTLIDVCADVVVTT